MPFERSDGYLHNVVTVVALWYQFQFVLLFGFVVLYMLTWDNACLLECQMSLRYALVSSSVDLSFIGSVSILLQFIPTNNITHIFLLYHCSGNYPAWSEYVVFFSARRRHKHPSPR